MDVYGILVHMHSGLRWVALVLLLWAIINAARSQASGNYLKKDKMINLFAMVLLHVQLLIGIGLYFINGRGRINYSEGWMSNHSERFYGMEHVLMMLIAITVITIGRSRAEKKLVGSRNKHRAILISYTLGLLIILASIPWPFGPWADFGSAWA